MSSYKIYPVAEIGDVKLSSLYIDANGKTVYIDRDGHTVKQGQPEKGVRVMSQMISRAKPLIVQYDKGAIADEAQINHWRDHSTIVTNGYVNKNLKQPQFILEIESEVVREANKVIQQKGIIYNQLNGMDRDGLKEQAFLFNEFDPSKMEKEEIFVKLVGVKFDGPALTKKHMTPNGEVLLFNHFRTKDHEDKEMLIVIMKAINWSILRMENGSFYSGQTSVGASPEEILINCRANYELYKNNIRAKVVRSEMNIAPPQQEPEPAKKEKMSFAEMKKEEKKETSEKRVNDPNYFKGVKPELTEEEIQAGYVVKSHGFGNYSKVLATLD